MTTERIDIVVREDGSRVVRRNLEEIGTVATGVDGKIAKMTSSLKTMSAVVVAAGIGLIFNSFIRNTIEAEQTVAQLNAALKSTAGVSGQTSSGLQKMASDLQDVTTYGDEAVMQMQSVLLTFTRLRGNQFVGAQEAVLNLATAMKMDLKGAALQVGKALNDPVQGLTALSRAGIQFTDDQKELIKKLAEGGKMAEAQTLILKELETQFGGSARAARETLGGALTALREKFGDMFELDSAFSEPFRKAIEFINTNMASILKILTVIGVTIAAAFAPAAIIVFAGWVGQLITRMKALWVVMAANPIGAVAVALTAVVTALTLFRDEIKLGIDDTTTLGDLMRAVWETVGPMISEVGRIAKDVFGFITEELGNSVRLWTGLTAKGTSEQGDSWFGLLRSVVRTFDAIGATVRGVMIAIGRTIEFVVTEGINRFKQLGDVASKAMTGDFAGSIASAVQAGTDSAGAFGKIGDIWAKSINGSFGEQMKSGLEAGLEGWVKRAKEISAERLAAAASAGGGGGPGAPPAPPSGGDKDGAKKAAKDLEQLKDALRQLKDAADPVGAAMRQLADDQLTLDKAVAKHLITQKEATAIYEELKFQMRDQLDPLAALNRSIDESVGLLKMSNDQRTIEQQMLQYTNQLRKDGKILTDAETGALRAKLVVEQELAKISAARDSYDSSGVKGQLEAFANDIKGFQASMAGGGSGAGDIAGAINSMLPWANLEGSQEQMDAYVAQHQVMYEQIKMLSDAHLINQQTANSLMMQADNMYMEQRLQGTRNLFGALAGLSSSGNRRLAAIGKAAAVADAVISGILATQKALAAPPGPPYTIPMAAITAGMAAVNVAKIVSTPLPGFKTGGEFRVGGSGGPDSQTVAFRGSPNETVSIKTPQQMRDEARAKSGPTIIKKTEVNVMVPPSTDYRSASQIGQYAAEGVSSGSRND